jgi:hypothetical protein
MGWFVTHAANSSWERRSFMLVGAEGRADGAEGTVGVGAGAGADAAGAAVVPPLRAEERRPHWGQTTSPAEPVDWTATWQCGQRVLRPVGV